MRITSCLPLLALATKVACLPYKQDVTGSPSEGSRIITDDNDLPFQGDEPLWEVQVSDDEEPKYFSGSVEEAYKKVLDLNPDYGKDRPVVNVTLGPDDKELNKRDVQGNPVCWDNRRVNMLRMQEEVFRLDRMNAYLNIAPRRCSRIGCSWNAGIAICNDRNDLTWSLHTSLIISYVSRISNSCSYQGVSMGGQQFDTGGFNVIAANMNCGATASWAVGTNPP
ncbi:Ff.00g064440.m01.CDS01 [Fusarium sp. VM40]|nr:Ff.00g064440.m01.CDS01 [Fusarium sp. VM40]